MNKVVKKKINIDTQPSKFVVVDSLTRDISIEACIFDLIDNSIDAARDTIYRLHPDVDKHSPPKTFLGYKISLYIDGNCFKIIDNCGGIPSSLLERSALRFGDRSSHNLGIGVFGVGLNRAIFKLGTHTEITTDTGTERINFIIDTPNYLKSLDWSIPAQIQASVGKIETTINISKLSTDLSHKFGDQDWVGTLSKEIGQRYAKILDKNLEIKLNKKTITSTSIKIKSNSAYEAQTKFFKTNGVSILIEQSQHELHKFSGENNYDKDVNASLANEYGWTIFCNERAILICDKTRKTGWIKKFHSEFNGFIGTVSFSSSDPSLLPWNTSKTDIDLNNPAYQIALSDMEKCVEKWRKHAGAIKRAKNAGLPIITPPASATIATPPTQRPNGKPSPKPASNSAATVKKPTIKIDHNNFSTILPLDINEINCEDKLLALVHEAKRLDLNYFTYSGLVLMRILFEASTVFFLVRRQKFDILKSEIVASRNIERSNSNKPALSQKEIRGLEPSLDEILTFLNAHDEVWDTARRNKMKQSMARFAGHKPVLNGAAHNTFQTINKLTAFAIREEILPALRYFIEN